MASLFGGIKDAQVSRGGVYLLPGGYTLDVDVLKLMKTRKAKDMAIAEFTVVESNVKERPVGSKPSHTFNFTDHEAALGNFKNLLSALFNIPEEDVDEAGAEQAVSTDNPCKGMRVRAEASQITTKAGKPFTKVQWFPVTEEAAK